MGGNNSTVFRTVFTYCIVASRKLLRVNEAAITQYHDPPPTPGPSVIIGVYFFMDLIAYRFLQYVPKQNIKLWIGYLQAPWQCRVPRCPGLCIGRCPRGPDGPLHLVAADPAPESHTSCSAARFMRREKLSFVSTAKRCSSSQSVPGSVQPRI